MQAELNHPETTANKEVRELNFSVFVSLFLLISPTNESHPFQKKNCNKWNKAQILRFETLDFTMQVKLLQAGLHQSTSQIHEMKLQLQLLRTQMQAASTPVCVLICHLFSPPHHSQISLKIKEEEEEEVGFLQ
jgi:hypothetical protein